jgi:1,2-diacylglycerol 3-beta-galactosyltransferase
MKRLLAVQGRVDLIWDERRTESQHPAPKAQTGNILILTASTGAGHDCVAVALQGALHELAPEVGVRTLDPLAGPIRNGPLSLGRWYDALVVHAPWLWGLVYKVTNHEGVLRLGMAAGTPLWARRLRSAVQRERPALIVSVHPVCTRLAASILPTVSSPPLLHCVVTDLVTIHRCWVSGAVETFYVATPEARAAILAMGIPPERLHVTGLPLRASFRRVPDMLVEGTSPRVLLLGGGCPSGQTEKVAHALVASHLPLHLVVVCGRNTGLKRRLGRALGTRATVLGWHDDIAALMGWSSVVVTKAGPTTVAEALSQARPLVISHQLPGQERGNVTLATRSGLGLYMPDARSLVHAIASHRWAGHTGSVAQAAWWGSAAGGSPPLSRPRGSDHRAARTHTV